MNNTKTKADFNKKYGLDPNRDDDFGVFLANKEKKENPKNKAVTKTVKRTITKK